MDKVKDKFNKPPMHLTLWKSVRWLIRVRLYGLKKYPNADNWKSVPTQDWWDACMRHLIAYNEGKIIDDESGLPHLAHALTNLCYLIELTTPEPEFKECGDIELTNNTQGFNSNSAIVKPIVDSKPNNGKNNFAFFSKFVSNRGRNKK